MEDEIQESRKRYEELRKEHEDLQVELKKFTEYASKTMNTEVINNLNQEKEDLILS